MASALNDVTREFGAALGVALLGAVLTAGYRGAIDSRLAGVPDAAADTAREGIANALVVADLTGPQASALARAARESFVDGWQQAMWAGAVVMAVLFVYVLARGPRQRRSSGVPTGSVRRLMRRRSREAVSPRGR
jgi:hypothetical protein